MKIVDGKRIATVTDDAILGFFGEYRFMSNFYPSPMTIDGIRYSTSEHAYMAAKTLDKNIKLMIRDCVTPRDARNMGQKIEMRADWNNIHRPIAMYECLIHKFAIPDLRKMLLDTGDKYLEETNNWGDRYWGVDGSGKNMLGRTLMLVRNHYKN